jgi:outer membrane factor, OMF family
MKRAISFLICHLKPPNLKKVKSTFSKIILLALLCGGFSIPAYTENYSRLESININSINIEELFYKKHLNTDYDPIKLEASLSEPIDLTISDVIAKAIENNLNLKISKQNSKAAKWKFWNRFGDLLPDLSMNLSKQNREGTFFINSNFQAPIDETISSAGLRLNYRAFSGGTPTFLALSEKYFREATNAREKSQYNLTLFDSVRLYLDLLKSQASLSTNLKALERSKANYDLASKFLKAGNGTKFEVMQADAQLARAQQKLIEQEANFRAAEINLSEHLNVALNSVLTVSKKEINKLSLIDENIPIEEFLKTSFKKNPDIQAALQNKKAIARQSFSTAGGFMPTLDLYLDVAGVGSEWSDLNRVDSLGFDLNYNIGQGLGFNAVSNALESKANLEKAELEYLQEMQRIEKALRLAYLNFQKSKSIYKASEKEFYASEEAYRLSQLRFKNGIEVFANLLDREADLNQAQLNLINAATEYNLNQVRLAYDMGTISVKEITESGI